MANICNFSLMLKGSKENIETFKNYLSCNDTVYMGRGAKICHTTSKELEDGNFCCQIEGQTKWSIQAALVDNAISMRTKKNIWSFGKEVDKNKLSFITLFEACEQLNLSMECYSIEHLCCVQEHYIYKDGKLLASKRIRYVEKYNEETNELEITGGFNKWDFQI